MLILIWNMSCQKGMVNVGLNCVKKDAVNRERPSHAPIQSLPDAVAFRFSLGRSARAAGRFTRGPLLERGKRGWTTSSSQQHDDHQRSGAAISNYPFQFGRPFLDGAIANEPQVLINGQPVCHPGRRQEPLSRRFGRIRGDRRRHPDPPGHRLLDPDLPEPDRGQQHPADPGADARSNDLYLVATMSLQSTAGVTETASARLDAARTATTSCGPRGRWRRRSCSPTIRPRANTTSALAMAIIRFAHASTRPSGRRPIRSLSGLWSRTGCRPRSRTWPTPRLSGWEQSVRREQFSGELFR